jgi:hypothetical protein
MRPSDGRIKLWPLAVIIIVFTFVALSVTPTVKLNNAPPADFVALHASAAGPKAALARGYWDVAARVIEWKYSRAVALPVEAPAEFALADGTDKPGNIEDQAARAIYWTKLREEWLKPDNWHTNYGVDWRWPARNAQELSRAIMQFINKS